MGMLTGWHNYHEAGFTPGISNYQGVSISFSGGFNLPAPGLIGQIQFFGTPDGRLKGSSAGVGVGFDPMDIKLPPAVGGGASYYFSPARVEIFHSAPRPTSQDALQFVSFMLSVPDMNGVRMVHRVLMIPIILRNGFLWDQKRR